jgi:MrfA Zn-binding domain/Phage derived protein Gp49-like (DUF891)
MDAVPGGTGYLKTLYQEKDALGREGDGIMDVLRRARDTLETCRCRILKEHHEQEDTDGCYRCVRTYHLQYSAERISRERVLHLLSQMIAAGEKRERKTALAAIKPDRRRPYRILYAFDPRRTAILLISGDKTGQVRGYDTYVPIADRLYDEHLATL